MNQELKQKWVAALRSGKYKQGREKLCADGLYCCLGVLYELTGKQWLEPQHVVGTGIRATEKNSIAQLYGYERELGIHEDDMAALARMNDGDDGEDGLAPVRPHTFSEIADYIEANL